MMLPGRVAQLGERIPRTDEVGGSNPLPSTRRLPDASSLPEEAFCFGLTPSTHRGSPLQRQHQRLTRYEGLLLGVQGVLGDH